MGPDTAVWAGASLRPIDASAVSSAGPLASPYSLRLDFQVVVAGVAHFAEAGHKEVIAPMIGGGVLLDVGKLHKLPGSRERNARERGPAVPPTFGPGPPAVVKPWDIHIPGAKHPRTRLWPAAQSKSQHQTT